MRMLRTVGAAALGAALLTGQAMGQTGNPGGPINDNLGDPNYGVCRGVDPQCFHDWPRPKPAQYKVLLYTRTAGPRHEDLGAPLGPGLNPPLGPDNVVQREMLRLAAANGVQLDYTEDLKVITRMSGYNAVIFFSTSRDNLDDDGKTALRQYMRAGGGFVGIHNAFGTLYNWPYYEGLLGNANFYDHGPERPGLVVVQDNKDVSTKGLPAKWQFTDEWYNLIPFPTHVRFLATVDEASWGAGLKPPARTSRGVPPPGFASMPPSVVGRDPGHGAFHPVAWCQYYDGGKVWVTTLGHDAGDFSADDTQFPGALEFQSLIWNGIKSVMGAEPFCQ
ncbi:MAG TPA: ThuA domain-containing protein [Caulobacteraceae bacterium]|nr:ThuA domain-containing protein [Caulobacteraceae bacterium]